MMKNPLQVFLKDSAGLEMTLIKSQEVISSQVLTEIRPVDVLMKAF